MGITNDTLASFMEGSAFTVDVTCKLIFKIASTVLCVVVIGILVQKIVEPRFGVYHGELEKMEDLTPSEKKGLRASGISTSLMRPVCWSVFHRSHCSRRRRPHRFSVLKGPDPHYLPYVRHRRRFLRLCLRKL